MAKCPFNFVPLVNNDAIRNDFLGYPHGLCRSDPRGWVLGESYGREHAENIYDMPLRDGDVWIASYPKSGTTWLQHMIWLLMNDLDFGSQLRPDLRCPFIDLDQCTPLDKFLNELDSLHCELVDSGDPFSQVVETEMNFMKTTMLQHAEEMPRNKPRFIKTHLPFELLPPDLLKRNKIVYVARDPREVVVSYYHHHKLIRNHEFTGDFGQFFEYFLNEEVLWSPYWQHISQAWKARNFNNILIIFFSELKKDLRSVIERVSTFLGYDYDPDSISKLQHHLSIEEMRKSDAANETRLMVRLGLFKEGEGDFMRKPTPNGWKDYLDKDMRRRMKEWMLENAQKYDLPDQLLWDD